METRPPTPGDPARPAGPVWAGGPGGTAIGSPASTNGNGKIAGQVAGTPERASNRAEWQAPQKVSADASPVAAQPPADTFARQLQSPGRPRPTDELHGRRTNQRGRRGTA